MILSIRAEADRDTEEAAQWYERQRIGLGREFLDELKSTLIAIQKQPQIYAPTHGPVRRALMRRFPFGVYYHLEEDRIIIFAVMHGSRNPSDWKGRI